VKNNPQINRFHYDAYRSEDSKAIDAVIAQFPLATIITCDGGIKVSHIPLFRNPENRRIFGHVDAINPQFKGVHRIEGNLIFSGPNRYIPPEAYTTRQLPTWNYVTVHIDVVIEIVTELDRKLDILRMTTERLQPSTAAAFRFDPGDPRIQRLAPGITGLSIIALREEGRFKLSQDKSGDDQIAALNHLLAENPENNRSLLMGLLAPHASGCGT